MCVRPRAVESPNHQDVISNDDFKLSEEFQSSFLGDIVKGVEYLHLTLKVRHCAAD